ncbi:carbohydrate-binding protein [Nocardia sp. NPDC050712]|uniref:carbohydrate-binding protein n=1 Tax=Nocardia sp. NPDC050712 TaxID=3155518 RepID=UPI0033EC652E
MTEPVVSEWTLNTRYEPGDLVTYIGRSFECLQAHTSNPGWAPVEVFTLWRESE